MNATGSEIYTETKLAERNSASLAFITNFASIAAAIGIILCLLGYGVALAVEETFGIPHSSLFQSPFELLDLSSIAIVQMVIGGVDLLKESGSVIAKLYVSSWETIVLSIVGWLALLRIFILIKPATENPRLTKIANRLKGTVSKRSKGIFLNILVIGVIAAQPILVFAFFALSILATSLLAIAPLLGMSAGSAFIQRWVVEAEQCKPILTAKQHGTSGKKITTVSCIDVFYNNDLIGSGRLVISTSNAVVLYDPNTKSVKRIPIDGMTLQSISVIRG